MLTKREYFEFCPTATEKDWKAFCKQVAGIEEEIWNEDHPMDE